MADLSNLLIEISSDTPCGENLEYDNARVALDTNIQGIPENQFTGEKAQPPNWRDIQKEAIALLQRSKDLQVVLYLIRALIAIEGIKGFRDGLNLLNQSLDQFWDQIHPQLDPDDGLDPTLRVNIIEELVSQELVLHPLTLVSVVESRLAGRFSLRDIQYATDRLPVPETVTKPEVSTIKAAFLDVEVESLDANYQAIVEAVKLVDNIEKSITEKVGSSNGPNLAALRSLLKDFLHAFEQMAGNSLNGSESAEDGEAGDVEMGAEQSFADSIAQVKAPGKIASRQDVLKALDAICKYYSEFEPSSPVPVLLQRAKYLVTADFAAIVQNLLPDALNQLQLFQGPDPNKEQESDY